MKKTSSLKNKKILVGITGSIAVYKAAELVSRLKQEGGDISVVMTAAARKFMEPLTFRTLSGNPVYADLFQESERDRPLHIDLAGEADLIVVAPATADFIARLSVGRADDLLSALILAFPGPLLIAPAMNERMYHNPIVGENILRLKKRGHSFVGPDSGNLACGYEGEGRLTTTEKILEKIVSLLKEPPVALKI